MNRFKDILKNKIFLTIFLSGLIFMIVLFFSNSLSYLDKKITYSMLSFKNHLIQFSASKDIVIIEIDDKTLNKYGYPYSRNIYVEVIKNLKKA
jgi:CHASE2 domain-containing sensor protein